jgi:hypothetical protein
MDNIAIVTASLLGVYTNVKNRAPRGSVLVLTPPMSNKLNTRNLQKVLTNIASYFRSRGSVVTTIQATRLAI